MELFHNNRVLIVGLGLIGGSYAKALKKKGVTVTAMTRSQESIDYALQEGIIDEGTIGDGKELIQKAGGIVIALYPGLVKQWIQEHQQWFLPGIRITDVTGIKGCVVDQVQEVLRPDVEFISAHPMAGREVYGVQNSDDRIFQNANYLVVPSEKNTPEAITWCENLGKELGFHSVTVLSPQEHDKMIAYVSQLTHCIAIALMTCNNNEHLVEYTGDSFRDLTRIARINEDMWSELFFKNKEELLHAMDIFIEEMDVLRELIRTEDMEGLKEKMRLSTRRRALFDKPQ
ncbi:MAG: prephenate dehydrogenase [Lachnospiraceae bacterium]